MITIISVLYLTIVSLFVLYDIRKNSFCPFNVFLLFQVIQFIGISILSNKDNSSDLKLILLYFISALLMIVTTIIYRKLAFVKNNNFINERGNNTESAIWALVIISVLICYLFFMKTNTNIIFIIIKMISSGQLANLSQLRKINNFASGSGIVYQFRVYILPLSVYYLIVFGDKNRKVLKYFLFLLSMIFITASGQRGGLVTFVLIIIINTLLINKMRLNSKEYDVNLSQIVKRSRKYTIILSLLGFFLFLLLTIANGRDKSSGGLMNAIIDRVINDNQYCAVYGFRLVDTMECCYGKDWVIMFLGLIPVIEELPFVSTYVPFSSIIHSMFYGSTEGTSPLCIWGSTYYNFGVIGVLLISIFLAFVFERIHLYFVSSRKSGLSLLLYSSITVILGTWNADGIYYPFSNGVIAIIIMAIFVKSYFAVLKMFQKGRINQ